MKLHRGMSLALAVAALMAMGSAAFAGDLYQLELRYCTPYAGGPTSVTVEYYEGDQVTADRLRGTTTVGFDGLENTNDTCDSPTVCVTDISFANGELCVTYLATGHDNAKFKSNSLFQVMVDGSPGVLQIHTSCSRAIPVNTELSLSDDAVGEISGGSWTVTGGTGECLPGAPGCPVDDKAFELDGRIRVPGSVLATCALSNVTFNVYKKDNELKGTATAMWDGTSLTNIVNDAVAQLISASLVNGDLFIEFESNGSKDDGTFESETSWEIDLGGCGTFKTEKIHTSCSQPIYLGVGNAMGAGVELTLTGGCGGCLIFPPVSAHEESTWGGIKSRFDE